MDLGYFHVRSARRASALGHFVRRRYHQASRLVRLRTLLGFLSVDQPRARLHASAISRLGRLPRHSAHRNIFASEFSSKLARNFAENFPPLSFLAAPRP